MSVPADLDGDGRLDVVSCAFIPTLIPSEHSPNWPRQEECDSIIWLRQISPGKFHLLFSGEGASPFTPGPM